MVRPNNEFEKIMELSNKILDEMESRNKIDKEVDRLLADGQYEEVKQLLNLLDNNIIRQIKEERDQLIHHTETDELAAPVYLSIGGSINDRTKNEVDCII